MCLCVSTMLVQYSNQIAWSVQQLYIKAFSSSQLSCGRGVCSIQPLVASPQPTLIMPRVFNRTIEKRAPYVMPIRLQVRALEEEEDFIFQDFLTYLQDKWQQLTTAMVQRQQTQKDWQWRMGWQALWDEPLFPMPRTLMEEYYPGGMPDVHFKCVLCVCWTMGLGQPKCPKYRHCSDMRWLPAKVIVASDLRRQRRTRAATPALLRCSSDGYTVYRHLRTPMHNMNGINASCICVFCKKQCANPGGVLHHMKVHHPDKVHDGEDSWKKDMEALYNVKLHCLILRTWDFLGLTSFSLMMTTWVFNHWDIWAANSRGRIGSGTWDTYTMRG